MWWVALALGGPVREVHSADPAVETAVRTAESYLGTEYRWEGRDTTRLPGLDCLGLLYRGWGAASGTSWRRYPVDPTKLVASGLLGQPVPGVSGVTRDDFDPSTLRRGDVLYLLLRDTSIPDAPLWVADGSKWWPWHTVLYVGDGRVLHAAPGDEVRYDALDDLRWDGLFATRR